MSRTEKVDYVKRQPQVRAHECHWPGCKKQVPPAMWGCKVHWFKLPRHLRNKIWDSFQPGQESGDRPVSRSYIEAAKEVQKWIEESENVKSKDLSKGEKQ